MNDEDKIEEQVKAAVGEATATPELSFSAELVGGRLRISGTLNAPAVMVLGLIEAAKMHYIRGVVEVPKESKIAIPRTIFRG